MAYSSKNPHLSTTLIKDQTTGSVGTAPSGSHRLVNRNGALYMVDASGNESPVGAAGQGELNVVANPSAAAAITGWAASNTGITVARTTTSTDLPLASVVSSAIKITPVSGTTDYVYYRWTMPAALKERKLKLEWHQRPLSGYAAGDLKVDVWTNTASDYSGTAARLALSTDSSAVTSIPNATGKFTTTFDGDASDYYEIRIYRTAGTTALNIANVIVGPGIQPQGAVVGEWQSYTPTLGTGTRATTYTERAYWRRVGTSMEIHYYYRSTSNAGAADGSGSYTWSIPSGYTIDTSSILAASGTLNAMSSVGVAQVSAAATLVGQMFATSSTTLVMVVGNEATTPSTVSSTVGNYAYNGTLKHTFHATVPIAEWSGSGTLNVGAGAEVEYASVGGTWDANSTTTVYGPGGVLMGGTLAATRTKTITWQYPVQATDRIQIFASRNQRDWFPINGCRLGSSADPVVPSVSAAGANLSGVSWTQGANAYETIVYFSQYMQAANDDSPTINWPSAEAYWVATKSSGGQAVGFGQVTQTGSGLVKSAGQLLGTNTNDSAATGYVGEYFENNRTSTIAVTSATYFSIDTGNSTFNDGNEVGITLTPGDWDISGSAYFDASTNAVITQPILFIGTAKGTSTTGQSVTKNFTELNVSFATSGDVAISTPVWRVSISSSTTYYLKARCNHTGGTGVTAIGNIRARRVR